MRWMLIQRNNMKTRKEWLYQLRMSTPKDTLEKVIGINSLSKAVAFFSAADHHWAEQVMDELYDKVSSGVWKYVY